MPAETIPAVPEKIRRVAMSVGPSVPLPPGKRDMDATAAATESQMDFLQLSDGPRG
jgi:hypothetical protein